MRRSSNAILFTLFVLLLINVPCYSYLDSRYGQPLVTSYTPDDFPGDGQCFDVAVTSQNIVYVANSLGVLEFDGVYWTLIPGTENKIIFSIAVDDMDRVWVGGQDEVGVLIPDTTGILEYHTLLNISQHPVHPASRIWRIAVSPDGIYFQSPFLLIRYRPSPANPLSGEITHWPSPDNGITMTRYINGRLFVKRAYLPLQEILSDSLVTVSPVNEDDRFTLVDCDIYDDSTFLFTPYNKDIQLFNENGFSPLKGEIQNYTGGTLSMGAMRIDEDRFVLSSTYYGLVVFDKKGNVLEIINTESGLPSNAVNRRTTIDQEGGIWVALDYGLARIELNSPYRILSKHNDISGSFVDLQFYHNHLLAGSPNGLFMIPFEKTARNNKPNLATSVLNYGTWSFRPAENNMIAGTLRGPVMINENLDVQDKISRLESNTPSNLGNATSFAVSPNQKDVFVFIELKGIYLYKLQNGKMFLDGNIDLPQFTIYSMAIKDTTLWITDETSEGNKLYRSKISLDNPEDLNFEPVETGAKVKSRLFSWDNQVFVDSEEGILYFNSEKQKFESVKYIYGDDIILDNSITAMGKISENRFFISAGPYNHNIYTISPERDHLSVEPILSQFRIRNVLSVTTSEDHDIAFFGCDDGRIASLDLKNLKNVSSLPVILIRNVHDEEGYTLATNVSKTSLNLKWPNNSLRFNYSLTALQSPELNQYRFRLKELSNEWSHWSYETYKDFNNISPGSYTFEVMGKNAFGISSDVASFQFIIHPPWYRTALAWIIWFVLFGILVYGFIRYRLIQLERQKRMLEALVKDRTRQLHETQQKELQEINARKFAEIEAQRLLTATKLATAVSHEFNNPLAIIQGRVELMGQQDSGDDDETHKDSILKQINRMKKLVNQLRNIDHLPEVDYIEGIKMIDLHNLVSPKNDNPGEETSKD